MRTANKILAIVFAISVIGNLMVGKIFIAGIVFTILAAYFGWRKQSEFKEDSKMKKDDNHLLSEFSKRFNRKEKLSVIRLCWLIAGLSEEKCLKAKPVMQGIYTALGLPFTSEILQESRKLQSELVCSLLKNHEEKEWVVVCMHNVAWSDNSFSENELKLFSMYCDGMNVTEEKAHQIINHAQKFTQDLEN